MKKFHHIKKAVALTIGIILIGTSSACTEKTATTSNLETENMDTKQTEEVGDDSKKDDSTEKTITVAMQQDSTVKSYEDNTFTQLLYDKTGVKIKFQILPSSKDDAKTKVLLMVSSGSKLPDVLNTTCFNDAQTMSEFTNNGVLLKLNDYFENQDYSFNYNKIAEPDKSYILNAIKRPDGAIYGMPKYNPQIWNDAGNRMWYNSDFLDKLNIPVPKTTDEFEKALKTIVDSDPNGNGKNDEIGLVGSKDGWGQMPYIYLMNAFTYTDAGNKFFAVKDGKVYSSFTTNEWKEGLIYMNKLVNDGLYSPLSFTQDPTQLKSLVNVKDGVVGFVPSASYSTFQKDADETGKLIPLNNYHIMAPLVGPKGVQTTSYNPSLPTAYWYITKDCEDPISAFKVGDAFYDDDVTKSARWGLKDVDWSGDPAIVSTFLGSFEFMGVMPDLASINPVWGTLQNHQWADVGPSYTSVEGYQKYATIKKSELPLAIADIMAEFYENCVPTIPKTDYITKMYYYDEELEKIGSLKTAIDQYVNTSIAGFISGSKPISEWDSYIDQLNKLGLEEYLLAAQKAYETGEEMIGAK